MGRIAYKHLLCLWVLILVSGRAFSSVTAIDSLADIISKSRSERAKLDACVSITGLLSTKDFEKAIEYGSKGLQLAVKLNDSLAIGKLENTIGEALYFKGSYDQAATRFYHSIQVFERHNNKKELAFAYNSLAKLYRKTRDLENAEHYYNAAMQIFRQLNDSSGMEIIYNESGVVFEYRGDYTEAINRYKQALTIGQAIGDSISMSYSLSNLAGAYVLLKDYAKAETQLLAALRIRMALKDTFALALTYSDLGTLYKEKGDYPAAVENVRTSNSIAGKMAYLELLSANYKLLAQLSELQNNYKEAFQYQQTATLLHDSIFTIEKARQIAELNTKYQTEKKEQQLLLQQISLSRKNYILAGTLLMALLGVALGYSYYKRYKLKQQALFQQEIMNQQEIATKAVLEAEEKERERIGQDLHDGVGQLMSAVKINLSVFREQIATGSHEDQTRFENIISLVDESCKEVRSVSHNMMPNALLKAGLASAVRDFLNKIDNKVMEVNLYTEGLDSRLPSDVETILYRVIQECVNNVVKHSGANRLDISITRDEEGIDATIEDNGKGFDVSDNNIIDGIGLKNIRTRVEYLKGTVDFDSGIGRGAVVVINIPFTVKI